MTEQELKELDLRLFKEFYPEIDAYIADGCPEIFKRNSMETLGKRFTKSPDSCFSILIPKMNKRGFKFDIIIDTDGRGIAWFYKKHKANGQIFETGFETQAICLASSRALEHA